MSTNDEKKGAGNGIDKATQTAITIINTALEDCTIEKVAGLEVMQQAIMIANGMEALRRALTDEVVEKLLMPLQGTPLGFRTDKDAGQGYGLAVVRECAIEAMMRGFRPVGNEFNIIAGRAYFTKEGYTRKVDEFEGLTDLEHEVAVPVLSGDKGALVAYRSKWKLKGIPQELNSELVKRPDGSTFDGRIPVRVNSGMTVDAILGKARRKQLKKIYEKISGVTLSAPDGDAIDTTGESVVENDDAPAKPEEKNANAQAAAELANKHKQRVQDKKNGGKAEGQQGSLPNADPAADSSGNPEPGANG